MDPNKHELHMYKIKEGKDIWVIIYDKLSFSSHITAKVNKANSIMG